ncbi:MucR family transcriptional regulator [Neptunicoccus cionae]|uniref:MucR family transcriptional regulator n=1 Tax=Neptunicoccus cionae TaxID=2035344 RepID=UPI000C761403|nr:MucR family transcriptional regulator [Amylibacter cionae]PLS23684.1 MucR family transcriptional regulator [Amylibacter cionae]
MMTHTTRIVSAYLQGNKVDLDQIATVMDVVHQKVTQIYQNSHGHANDTMPAVPVEDSVTPDHIICLEDGKAFKMLKKHLKSKYDLSPEEYRAKWGLPTDYPMVAPNYAAKRQELAKASGLGRNR